MHQNYLRASAQPTKKGYEMIIDTLRRLDADSKDLDELVELSAFARLVRDEYEKLGGEVPAFVSDAIRTLRRETASRFQGVIEKSLHEKMARMEHLKPAEQRRQELQAEIDALKARLPQDAASA
jgi:hypothetical protein